MAFDATRPVERAKLIAILEAARWAPSCYNEQPWRYLVCDRFGDEQSWNTALDCLVPGNQRWAKRAPVLIAAISCDTFSRNEKENRWSQYDNGAASENMCLQASDLGLAMHQMGGFDDQRLLRDFDIPAGHSANAMIALGYHGDPADLNDSDRARQSAPRNRRSLDQFAYMNRWGSGIDATDRIDPVE